MPRILKHPLYFRAKRPKMPPAGGLLYAKGGSKTAPFTVPLPGELLFFLCETAPFIVIRYMYYG